MALRIGGRTRSLRRPPPWASARPSTWWIPGQRKGHGRLAQWKDSLQSATRSGIPAIPCRTGSARAITGVNALQLAVMCAPGQRPSRPWNPRLIQPSGGVDQPHETTVADLPFPAEHVEIVRAGMAAVANDPTGGAYKQSQLGLGDVLAAGKTGTAQVRQYSQTGSRSNQGVPFLEAEGPQPVHRLRPLRQAALHAGRPVLVEHGGLSWLQRRRAQELAR
ncbi:penicillin-binding transpeptidase domain-containing protein [Caulobacter segnis]